MGDWSRSRPAAPELLLGAARLYCCCCSDGFEFEFEFGFSHAAEAGDENTLSSEDLLLLLALEELVSVGCRCLGNGGEASEVELRRVLRLPPELFESFLVIEDAAAWV
jgi:hypothetical protein